MKFKLLIVGIIALALMGCVSNTPTPPIACSEDAKICPDGTAVGRVGPNCEFAPCPDAPPLVPPSNPPPTTSTSVSDTLNCNALLQPLTACTKLAEGKFVSLSPGETKELYAGETVSYLPTANGKGMCIWEYAEHPTEGEATTIFANTRSTYVQMQLFNNAADAEFNFQGFKLGYPNAPMLSDNELVAEETTSFNVSRAHIKLAGSAVIQISQSHGTNVWDACTRAEEEAILETFQAP